MQQLARLQCHNYQGFDGVEEHWQQKAAALLADVGFTTRLPQNGGEGEQQAQKGKQSAECTEQATDAPATCGKTHPTSDTSGHRNKTNAQLSNTNQQGLPIISYLYKQRVLKWRYKMGKAPAQPSTVWY